jgi:hypothetical protein
MDYGTIKIPQDEYERHNERRKSNGQTWAEYIDAEAPEASTGGEFPTDISEQLDRIEAAATTAEDRVGDIERTLEELQR